MRVLMAAIVAMMMGASAMAGQKAVVLAGGCFWCVEADFEKNVPGVISAQSGYIGGSKDDATYKAVASGRTEHYEAVRIVYDDSQVNFRSLVDFFFRSVDPTDAGGQFCDRGPSYRTAVFVNGVAERAAAEAAKAAAQDELGQRIVTPILPASAFYLAEPEHQNYYRSGARVLTRFGWIKRKDAYARYRTACGRDARIKALWGTVPGS
ncbi:MAG: peptide-methionine (S)-S-oxide reductase MsrA [Pseudomonadota bacterium]